MDFADIVEVLGGFLEAAPGEARWKTLVLDDGGNVAGAMALGVSPGFFPGLKPIDANSAHTLKTSWGGKITGDPGLGWKELLAAAAEGKVQALLLVNSGRPAGWNFTEEEKRLLAKAPFVAAFDLFSEEVEAFAHVILPTMSFAEMDATYTTQDGVVQLARRNIVPRVPTSLQVLGKVAARMEIKLAGPQPIEVFREIAREVPQFAGLDYGKASREGARPEPMLAGA